MNDQLDSIPQSDTPKKVNLVRRILRGVAATFRFLRVSVANILLVIFFILVLGFLFSGPDVTVKPESVLVFMPNASLVEKRPNTNPLYELVLGSAAGDVTEVHEVVSTLQHAATNPRIRALEIRAANLGGSSLVHLEMLGEAMKTFSESGKPIYAYSDNFNQSAYVLSSYADAVYMNPLGSLSFSGVAFESMYFKSLLDRFDIDVHTFRSGEYKSAVEPFMLNSMSEIVRDSYRPIVDQLWNSHKLNIGTNRELELTAVEQFTENVAALLVPNRMTLAELAVEHGFIDELLTSDQVPSKIRERFGLSLNEQSFSRISTEEYYTTIKQQQDLKVLSESNENTEVPTKHRGTIAVITVEGAILDWTSEDGEQLVDSTGAVEHIEHAIEEQVDAIVLRINSPGGSVTASEAIRLQIDEAKSKNIPIVVSMSSVAASGGYWIAAGADRILAADSTITGSIGVFSMIPSVEKLLERIGVNNDGVYSSDGHFRLDLGMEVSETEARMLQAGVDDAYTKFLDIVSTGRGKTVTEVNAIAGGRIWTGLQALENGLIDEIGDYDSALEVAAGLAGLKSYVVKRYGFVRRPPFMNLLAKAANLNPTHAPQSRRLVQQMKNAWQEVEGHLVIEPKRVYALCEICPEY